MSIAIKNYIIIIGHGIGRYVMAQDTSDMA